MMNIFRNRVRWILIGWMFVISAVAYLDRVNISIAGGLIEQEYHLDHIQLGRVFAAFVWGYALSQAPGGRLADRFGPRRVLAVGTMWWAVFTSLTAAVPTKLASAVVVLMAARFLLGVGEAVVYPSSNRLVAGWVPMQERGLANGFIFAGVGVGGGITPPLVTFILLHYGWRWSFWASALIGLAAGVVWFLLVRDKPEDHPLVTRIEAAHIQAGLPSSVTDIKPLAWRKIFGSRDVLAVTFSYFCYGYVAYIFFTWFFTYLNKVRGLNLKSSSYYSMLPFLAMAICSLLGGWISDSLTLVVGKRVGRCSVACAGMLACTAFLALGSHAVDARLASVFLAGGAGALYISQSSFWSVSSEMAGASAGSVSGVMNMGNQIGGAITAQVTPIIAAHFGWAMPFLVAAGLCALGGFLWLTVDVERGLAQLSGIRPINPSNFRSTK